MSILYALELGKMTDDGLFFPTVNSFLNEFDNLNILGKSYSCKD